MLTVQWCRQVNRLLILDTATYCQNNHRLIGMHCEKTLLFPFTLNAYVESEHTQPQSVEFVCSAAGLPYLAGDIGSYCFPKSIKLHRSPKSLQCSLHSTIWNCSTEYTLHWWFCKIIQMLICPEGGHRGKTTLSSESKEFISPWSCWANLPARSWDEHNWQYDVRSAQVSISLSSENKGILF